MADLAAVYSCPQRDQAQAWAGLSVWRILATQFNLGQHFLDTWHAWQHAPQRPRRLHYVALCGQATPIDQLLAAAAHAPPLLALARQLEPHWQRLQPGFHRITLEGGQVLLTLCVGELTPTLRAQQFLADSVYLDPPPPEPGASSPWNLWAVKALARCCRRGTQLHATHQGLFLSADLTQCGFELQEQPSPPPPYNAPPSRGLIGQFNPRWTLRRTRSPLTGHAVPAGRCAVIGAGLAGASVASALAERGWQVQVLDLGEAPAAGASGLPVGLVVPHVSADDCALSRLSRSGVRLMLHQARSLLQQDQDWAPTGTRERQLNGAPDLPDLWHPQAAWLKPAQLVKAWLAQPGITFTGGVQVSSLRPNGDGWTLLDAQSQVLAHADRVVFANAGGALPLLSTLQAREPGAGLQVEQLPSMHGMRGQVSWAWHAAGKPHNSFPTTPVNGSGSVIPSVPLTHASQSGLAWFIGASYQPAQQPAWSNEKNHADNLARLQKLLPALGEWLAPQLTQGLVQAWTNTRCVTSDRLPLVGPVCPGDKPSLWICAGMGSRGLTFSMLCAELLAASWGAEPLPIDARLAQCLHALRGKGKASAADELDHPLDPL